MRRDAAVDGSLRSHRSGDWIETDRRWLDPTHAIRISARFSSPTAVGLVGLGGGAGRGWLPRRRGWLAKRLWMAGPAGVPADLFDQGGFAVLPSVVRLGVSGVVRRGVSWRFGPESQASRSLALLRSLAEPSTPDLRPGLQGELCVRRPAGVPKERRVLAMSAPPTWPGERDDGCRPLPSPSRLLGAGGGRALDDPLERPVPDQGAQQPALSPKHTAIAPARPSARRSPCVACKGGLRHAARARGRHDGPAARHQHVHPARRRRGCPPARASLEAVLLLPPARMPAAGRTRPQLAAQSSHAAAGPALNRVVVRRELGRIRYRRWFDAPERLGVP